MVSKTKALRQLSQRAMTVEEHEAFISEIRAEKNDRGACLLLAAHVENSLDSAIISLFSLSSEQQERLFNQDAPLGTFSRKILFANAVQIIGSITTKNLDIIRHVRNAFAHAKAPINFKTPEVEAICNDLQIFRAVVGDKFMLENPRSLSARS